MHAVFEAQHLAASSSVLLGCRLADVQTKTISVEVDLVLTLLQNGSNIPCVLELSKIDVTSALLDSVTNKLC